MDAKDVCVSLETAKVMYDVGIIIDNPCFMWVSADGSRWRCAHTDGYDWSAYPAFSGFKHQYPAPTADELLAIIPPFIQKAERQYWLIISPSGDCYEAVYETEITLKSIFNKLLKYIPNADAAEAESLMGMSFETLTMSAIKTKSCHMRGRDIRLCEALAKLAIKLRG